MAEKHKVMVTVAGNQVALITTQSAGSVQQLADQLNKQVQYILEQKPGASVVDALILTALSTQDAWNREVEGGENLRAQVRDYAGEANRSVLENAELRRENERLRQEIALLKRSHV